MLYMRVQGCSVGYIPPIESGLVRVALSPKWSKWTKWAGKCPFHWVLLRSLCGRHDIGEKIVSVINSWCSRDMANTLCNTVRYWKKIAGKTCAKTFSLTLAVARAGAKNPGERNLSSAQTIRPISHLVFTLWATIRMNLAGFLTRFGVFLLFLPGFCRISTYLSVTTIATHSFSGSHFGSRFGMNIHYKLCAGWMAFSSLIVHCEWGFSLSQSCLQ